MLKCMKSNILLTQNLTTKENHDPYSCQFFHLATHICMFSDDKGALKQNLTSPLYELN